MAAGASASGSLEATLDRKFQNVTNTMDSIQGLSSWCIDNKKYHSMIVRHWLKHVRKAAPSHRLNLLYLANDVIQNCKRKNAIVYRTAFSEVLVDAFLLINSDSDPKVIKSVERILSIWEERSVYEGNLISDLRNTLVKEESPPETPVEEKTPTESKADLRSRIVAEFVPQAFIDQLSKYKKNLDEVDLREKQLTAMRVDICNSETLRKLKDKAGGKKFSRDFEEGNTQLQEFVKFIEKQNKTSEPILEALSNADIFYEMQYKEVKIVANAYQTFANRVNHLKRKLDSLKATLPSLDDSPLPSPSADAPSPTGSESPFHSLPLALPDPDLDGSALDDDAEPPAPSPLSSLGGSPKRETIGASDNREVEDMDFSDDEEMDSGGIIVEEQTAFPAQTEVSRLAPESSESSLVPPQTAPEVAPAAAPPSAPPSAPATAPPAAAVEGVDLGKIGSFLNSLSSVIKNTGPSKDPHNPSGAGSAVDSTSAAIAVLQDSHSLSKLLAKVDMSASDLLSALTKVQAQGGLEGISSLLSSPPSHLSDSPASEKTPPPQSAPSPAPMISDTPDISPYQSPAQPEPATSAPTEAEPLTLSDSLESKIHNFLQGNPAFSAFDLDLRTTPTNAASPAQEGTPVRDEGGSTPTQDEVMDKTVVALQPNEASVGEASIGIVPQQNPVVENGRSHQAFPYPDQNTSQLGSTAPVLDYQKVLAQIGELPPGTAKNISNIVEKMNESGWFNSIFPEGSSEQSLNVPSGPLENTQPGQFPFQAGPEPPEGADVSASVYGNSLPLLPALPRPPDFYNPSAGPRFGSGVPEQQPGPPAEPPTGVSSLLSGVIVHDHQHKSVFDPEEPQFDRDPEYLDERPYHGDEMYQHELYQEEAFRAPGFGPMQRGRLTPPLSSHGNEYYDYQHGTAPRPRRPPPPHHPDMRPRGMRPPLRAPLPGHHLRGHPRPPFLGPRGPEPWQRGKRPGPRRGGPNFPPKRPFPGRR